MSLPDFITFPTNHSENTKILIISDTDKGTTISVTDTLTNSLAEFDSGTFIDTGPGFQGAVISMSAVHASKRVPTLETALVDRTVSPIVTLSVLHQGMTKAFRVSIGVYGTQNRDRGRWGAQKPDPTITQTVMLAHTPTNSWYAADTQTEWSGGLQFTVTPDMLPKGGNTVIVACVWEGDWRKVHIAPLAHCWSRVMWMLVSAGAIVATVLAAAWFWKLHLDSWNTQGGGGAANPDYAPGKTPNQRGFYSAPGSVSDLTPGTDTMFRGLIRTQQPRGGGGDVVFH